jgi:pSer/pThr/pTyr-binding forkhead associated (FHA) protein
MDAHVLFLNGELEGRSFAVSEETTVGRIKTNAIVVPGDDLISSHHCILYCRDNRAWVKDLDSTNGTEVNGQLTELADLHDGDEILIGNTRMVLRMTE